MEFWDNLKLRTCHCLLVIFLNPFHVTGFFLYPLETFENVWFSVVFRGYRKRPDKWNELMEIIVVVSVKSWKFINEWIHSWFSFKLRGIFRTHSNIYDGAFLWKLLTNRLGSKYASAGAWLEDSWCDMFYKVQPAFDFTVALNFVKYKGTAWDNRTLIRPKMELARSATFEGFDFLKCLKWRAL